MAKIHGQQIRVIEPIRVTGPLRYIGPVVEESFISTKQAGPSNLTIKKRAPPTPQSAKRDFLSYSPGKGKKRALGYLLIVFRRRNRAYAHKKKGWSSPDLQNQKSGPPPLLSFQNTEDECSTSCSYCSGLERLSALLHRRQCLAHPFIFPGDDALENFQSRGVSPSSV